MRSDGTVVEAEAPVGFSAALLPYLSARGEGALADAQAARDERTELYGRRATYYDQNLVLFGLGAVERQYWFDAQGTLRLQWADQ